MTNNDGSARASPPTTIVGGRPEEAGRPRSPARATKPNRGRRADITIVNLNMLYVRYFDMVERERHLPLGPLYVTAALERAGYFVDFRDYQVNESHDPFSVGELTRFVVDPAPIIGFSCMANLLPFSLLAMRDIKAAYPECCLVLAGVGAKSVEGAILECFPWVDVIVRGEAETIAPALVAALQSRVGLAKVPGVSYREGDRVVHNERPPRLENLDAIAPPAYHHLDLAQYTGFGVVTSRGCPYPCTFCSVAPIWDRQSHHRSAASVIAEMQDLHERAGANLILFQDEYFVSGSSRVLEFCDSLDRSGLRLKWKAFGRINLTDEAMMRAMERSGCVELRFGVESGSDRILAATKKGFTSSQTIPVVRHALATFPRVDLFYVWGYPFETMDDFYQSVFQMVSFRAMDARILPSLLCFLPQTEIASEWARPDRLEFAPDLFPEYMITGHEVSRLAHVEIRPQHQPIFDFVRAHPQIFPGFFHVDLQGNVRPKLRALQQLGFYPASADELRTTESCGAHSPRLASAR